MSYNINSVLEKRNLTLDAITSLSEKEQDDFFYDVLSSELPQGVCWLENCINDFKMGHRDPTHAHRYSASADPNSTLGKQIVRLFFDEPRRLFERRHDVSIGAYNCCRAVIAFRAKDLSMNILEQIKLQSTPHCWSIYKNTP